MTAAEGAEAFLIVTKRLLKWVAWAIGGVALVCGTVALGLIGHERYENRPLRLTGYHEIRLGDSQDEVIYALGKPSHVIRKMPAADSSGWTRWGEVIEVKDIPANSTHKDFAEWLYETVDTKALNVDFDKAAGRTVGIACMSRSSLNCPSIFGLRDGSTEEDVRSSLGAPDREDLNDTVKRMRYPALNLIVYLEKRRVYMLRVSEGAK